MTVNLQQANLSSQAQYQSTTFSGYMSQGCQQSFQSVGFLSYMSQYLFQVPSTSNVFYGPSQMFDNTFNTPPSANNPPPSSSCYCPSLPTQTRDMGHEDEEDDDDNNNTNNNDGDDDDNNGGDCLFQQQHTITHEHPKTR